MFYSESAIKKRINHILETIEDQEIEISDTILKNLNPPQLDTIKKKKLKSSNILYPTKDAPVEWWYFTGHVKNKKDKYGFEFCIFKFHPESIRIGPIPMYLLKKEPYLVLHSTITNKNSGKFYIKQDSGIIHNNKIEYKKLKLVLGNSTLLYNNNIFKIVSKELNLELRPTKPLIYNFDKGYEIMDRLKKHKAYYVSFPRMNVKGSMHLDKKIKVNGTAWFDHQKTNFPKKTNLLGWDWFSIQFKDNTELMIFVPIDKKGHVYSRKGGTYILKNGKTIKLRGEDIKIRSIETWKSSSTGAIYPSGWYIEIPKLKINIEVNPCVKNQEIDSILTTPVSYWEGACDVSGTKNDQKIKGQSYVELVGYDNRLIATIIKKSFY